MKKIKIAQISDIHWRGSTRHEEYTRAFSKLYEMLREEAPDIIVCTGDIFHTKTQGISPEIMERMVWMFQELLKIAPVRTILGNHDGNLANSSRQDVITPIVHAINSAPMLNLYKESGNFVDEIYPEIQWANYSCFDKEGWAKCSADPNKINIALFHGSIIGCQTDGGFRMMGGEESVNTFHDYDYVLMGDIHKTQFLSDRRSDDGTDKPWIGYPGSLIQQNFGEEETKGFLIWEIEGKNSWDVRFVELENFQPFLTLPWLGDLASTQAGIGIVRNDVYLEGTRYRIACTMNVSDVEKRQMEEWLRDKGAESVTWKIDIDVSVDDIDIDNVKIQKTSLRNNPEVLVQLYNEYLANNQSAHPLDETQKTEAGDAIKIYLEKLKASEPDVIARDVQWSLRSMDFDNLFRYGEGNSIDFTKLSGIVGVFGPNRSGKSSIPGTIMYTLFNATDRGPMKTAHTINANKTDARSRAHITIGGTDYVVERTSQRDEPKRKRKKEVDSGKTSTSLTITKVLPSGDTVPITGISRDESDKELRRLIGTSEDFLMTSFASQGDMNRFIQEGATERKAILSKFLDIDIFKKLCDYAKEDCAELNAKTKRYSNTQWEKLIDQTKSEISTLEASKLVLDTRMSTDRQEVEDLKLWIAQKEKEIDMVTIHQLEDDLEAKERQLENAQRTFNDLTTNIKTKQSELLQIDLALQGINIETLESEAEKVDELRDALVEAESAFKVESTTLDHQEKSVRKLDLVPCGDQFPQCHYIRDSHENKGKLEYQKDTVQKLKERLESVKGTIAAYATARISDKIKEHRLLSDRKSKAESAIRELKTRQKNIDTVRLVAEREKIRESLDSIRESFDANQEDEILKKKTNLKQMKSNLDQLEQQRSDVLVSLGSKKQTLVQSLQEKDECQEILGQLHVYESIYKAFSKNGIPAMILKSQLPAINQELDRILGSVMDFKVFLETDTSSNVMDVFIEDKDSRRVIEVASGMEKMITSIALRVALTNLSSLPKSDMFILDEGFGALDDVSLPQCLQLMSLLKTYFRVILVITHIAPIKEIADRIIDIKNDGSFSFVQV